MKHKGIVFHFFSFEMVEAASLEADVFRGKIIKVVAVFYKRTQELEETEP